MGNSLSLRNLFVFLWIFCSFLLYGCESTSKPKLDLKENNSVQSGRCVIDSPLDGLNFISDYSGNIFAYGSAGDDYRDQELYEIRKCKNIMDGRSVFEFVDDVNNKPGSKKLTYCSQSDGGSINGCRILVSNRDSSTALQIQLEGAKWSILISESSSADMEVRKIIDKFNKIYNPVDALLNVEPITDEDFVAINKLKMTDNVEFRAVVKPTMLNYDGAINQIVFLTVNMSPLLQTFAAFERNNFPHDIAREVGIINKFADDNVPAEKFSRLIAYGNKQNRFSLSDELILREMKREFVSGVSNVSDFELFYNKILELGLVDVFKRQNLTVTPIKEISEYGLRISWGEKSIDFKNSSVCREISTESQTNSTGALESFLTSSSKRIDTIRLSRCVGDSKKFADIEKNIVGNTQASNQLESSWEVSELVSTTYVKDVSPTYSSESGSVDTATNPQDEESSKGWQVVDKYEGGFAEFGFDGHRTVFVVRCANGGEYKIYQDKQGLWGSTGLGGNNSSSSLEEAADAQCR